jgi:hypothetical protein
MVARLVGCRTARLGGAAHASRRFVLLLAVTALAACGVEEPERPSPGRAEVAAGRAGLAAEAGALPATALCPPATRGMAAPDLQDEVLAALLNSLLFIAPGLRGRLPAPAALWRPYVPSRRPGAASAAG